MKPATAKPSSAPIPRAEKALSCVSHVRKKPQKVRVARIVHDDGFTDATKKRPNGIDAVRSVSATGRRTHLGATRSKMPISKVAITVLVMRIASVVRDTSPETKVFITV